MSLKGHEDVETRETAALEMRQFAMNRLESWRSLLLLSKAPMLRTWASRHPALYGIKNLPKFVTPAGDSPEALNPFHVLGGMAAIRETVQMQQLQLPRSNSNGRRTIPIREIKGVEVEALDFKELLEKEEGTDRELPLAHMVPMDRLMVYFARPESIVKVLQESSEFVARMMSILNEVALDYDMTDRYLSQLGLRDPEVMAMFATADIKDLVVMLPDLFLVDGTDLTAVIRCSKPERARFFLNKAGMGNMQGEQILERRTGPHSSAWWAVRDELILISTARTELDAVLKLHRTGGRRSLGQSHEFRYMLRRLPLQPTTQAYIYFSDPFLRNLVGPATKIGQYRRMQACGNLEIITSLALLYKLDGHPGVPRPETLQRLGYLPANSVPDGFSLGPELIAFSEQYGSAANLFPLSRNPVVMVAPDEEAAYRRYVTEYSRFWQQYFDPIALRVDEPESQTMEIATFILPLIKSSLYQGARDLLPGSGPRVALSVPDISPAPILSFSMNLSDSMRIRLTRQLTEIVADYTSMASGFLDSLGPSLHLVVHDSNPIVALGSGDIMRAIGGEIIGASGELFEVPTLMTLLTQPCQILVEVQDSVSVVTFLEEASLSTSRMNVPGELYKVEGQERWIYHLNLYELVRLSVSVEVKNGYLIISNLPWSQRASVQVGPRVPLNGAHLAFNLDAVQAHLPALHMATMTDYRAMALEGMGYWFPLLASGHASTVEEARSLHTDLFGYAPVHPANGHWTWENGSLSSSIFGTMDRPRQPRFDEKNQSFGLIRGARQISANMQMEDDGLRARLRWTFENP
jgi:hypothetical protein